MLKTRKRKLFILLILAVVVVCALTFVVQKALKAYAAGKPIRTITSFLKEKNIDYSDVSINNETLSVNLVSSGDGRCTINDIKAVQAIYEVVHAQTIDSKVKNVSIEIYDINGKMIFDHHENGVSAQVQNVDKLVKQDPEQKTDMAVDEILLYAENLVAKYPYSVQELKIDTASEISGKKLELILCTLNKNSIPSFSDIDRIYENLEAFSFSTKAITQCEITVNNTEGDGVYYMAGDFLYGNCIAWISPEAQSSFVKEYGPPDEYESSDEQLD